MDNSQISTQEGAQHSQFAYEFPSLVKQAVQRTFVWMALGLAITGLTAIFAADSNFTSYLFSGSSFLFYGLLIAELALVWFLSSQIMKLSVPVATASFALYSVLNGLTLSLIFYIYTEASIASTFFVTAGTFGAMALFGYVTKRDLSRWGSLLYMALIGLIIASVVNWFLASATLMWITTYAGVLIFVGLTAYDTQKIKQMLWEAAGDEELSKRVSLIGALGLYLDFINLFLYLLRILGRRR
ncbi:hypothetical protein HMPREF1556_01685 [Porphyromonas sp. oral taxon 278 str. W7784]|uniref:Bax inhibitor-1/YccA family protein n=1 Tax=Porphyromonas sp. oral taxon 278 TaxID=712437 RepID=UPI0003AD246A|nr:Bax inhibitor-1/YccA family protein [Porphyromonas sp. oral taxon 278]ERJ70105.1 hypothetical protein HMPREF1556_01685 [Porphyromonas sp. oral taxon 278 str. W7784]